MNGRLFSFFFVSHEKHVDDNYTAALGYKKVIDVSSQI